MKISDYETFIHNPFRVEKGYFRKIGEPNKDAELLYKTRDMENHIRIFPGAYEDFRNLNSMAVAILSYIFKEISGDVVRLNVHELMVEFGVTGRPTIYRGILDLLEKRFIVRKAGTDMYFINPGKIFNKSRAKWFEETSHFDKTFQGAIRTISTYETMEDKIISNVKGNYKIE